MILLELNHLLQDIDVRLMLMTRQKLLIGHADSQGILAAVAKSGGNMSLPFKEVLLESNSNYNRVLREFSKDLSNEELNWHRDKEDRLVEVKSGHDWYIQLENELPRLMSEGLKFRIPKYTWHRIINKNRTNLIIEIRKYK